MRLRRKKIMNKSIRFVGLSVSSLLFIALLGYVFSNGAHAQVSCPCNFDNTQKTTECWVRPFDQNPTYRTGMGGCDLHNLREEPRAGIALDVIQESLGEGGTCLRKGADIPPSCITESEDFILTPEEVIACQCELLAYVTALNDVEGISVLGGPPYTCQNVDCRQLAPAPIPTLSEWGLIAMAGVLGIVGFVVIRRRKALGGIKI